MHLENRKKQKSLHSFMDRITQFEKEKVDDAVAKFFFGCNIPFAVIESAHFTKMIRALRPAYAAPCRKTLSTTLLSQVNDEMLNMNKINFPKETALLIDGWKNSSKNKKKCQHHAAYS